MPMGNRRRRVQQKPQECQKEENKQAVEQQLKTALFGIMDKQIKEIYK